MNINEVAKKNAFGSSGLNLDKSYFRLVTLYGIYLNS